MTAIKSYFEQNSRIAPLTVFRVCFGLMMFAGLIRFIVNGWVESLYIEPIFHFSYYGFEFIKSPGILIYSIFAIALLSALLIAIGLFYRLATILFFLSFTYIELIDKATYLNHYYFISIIAFLLIFLPSNRSFSLDVFRTPATKIEFIPRWQIDTLKMMISIVYVYAGLAKINGDWLLHAMPLKIWLPAKNDLPFIGFIFNYEITAYLFSWLGCLYDLTIPFLLMNRLFRPFAFTAVILFHLITSILFPIGMFPLIMTVSVLLFFPTSFHENTLNKLRRLFNVKSIEPTGFSSMSNSKALRLFFMLFLLVQLIIPFRHLAYPGELFWTEEGYRFSWRVMLIEKTGYAEFTVKDKTGKYVVVNNTEFLSPLQEKMMSTQTDMILQYAHFLRNHYNANGYTDAEVYVDSYVSLNGRLGKALINREVNLARQTESLKHKTWINPFHEKITGL